MEKQKLGQIPEINKRIRQIRAELCYGSNKIFAAKLKRNPNHVTQICTGKTTVSKDFIENVLSVFAEINEEWLRTGTGGMLKESINKSVSVQGDVNNSIVGNDITAIQREYQARLDELYRQLALKDEIIKNLTDLLIKNKQS